MHWAQRLVAFLLISASVQSLAQVQTAENFRLLDVEGQSHELYRMGRAKAVVIFIHTLGCPIVDQSLQTLNQMAEQLKGKVEFLMLNPRPIDSRTELQKRSKTLDNHVPLLMDPTQVVARSLNVTRSAEAIVIIPGKWTIAYRGPIDDGIKGYGADRIQPHQNYLLDALYAIMEGPPRKIPVAPLTLGCAIHIEHSKPPSYAKTIAPILMKSCYRCHDGSNETAWQMKNYETIRQWAPMIRQSVMTRSMPPWWPDAPETTFAMVHTMSAADQSSLFNWIESGTPRGVGDDPLKKAKPSRYAPTPDRLVKLPEPIKIPSEGIREYQYAKLLTAGPGGLNFRGLTCMSQLGALHHATAFVVPAGVEIKSLMGARKVISVGRDRKYLATVGNPKSPLIFRNPYAAYIPEGHSIYLEMHFKGQGHPVQFDPAFGLYLSHEIPDQIKSLRQMSAANNTFKVPPREPNFRIQAGPFTFPNEVEIVAALPHMHLRGKSMKIVATKPDNSQIELISVPDFRAAWTRIYYFTHPQRLPAQTKIMVYGSYDNSEQNPFNPNPDESIGIGDSLTWSEMFLGHLYYHEIPSAKQ